MGKYIDADKLKTHIQHLIKKDNYELFDVPELLSFIDSLQQEQDILIINKKDWEAQEQFRKNKKFGKPIQKEQPEMDLEKEIDTYFQGWTDCDDYSQALNAEGECVSTDEIIEIARHFYKLGLNSKKEE